MATKTHGGFPGTAMGFLKALSANNNKEWFEAHRGEFERDLLLPAQEFVTTLGVELQKIRPAIQAIPKIDKSIFRLHRDVRFSKDKSPYKTNLGLFFWEGSRKKMECSGFYVHVEPGLVAAGAGMYMFTKDQLPIYRDTLTDDAKRKELVAIVQKLEKKGYQALGRNLKQVPRGYDKEMPNAELLLHDGIFGWHEAPDESYFAGGALTKNCAKLFKEMLPLHEWLLSVFEKESL